MQNHFIQTKILFKRLAVLLIMYTVLRILFYLFNHQYFPFPFFTSILPAFFLGLRFDISAIIYLNCIFIVLHIIPLNAFYSAFYQKMLAILFYACNIPFVFLNCVDFVYFRFILKRTTWDLFSTSGMSKDIITLLPSMLRDFWYVLLIALLCIFAMVKLYRKISLPPQGKVQVSKNVIGSIGLGILFVALFVIGFRGGLQYRPINLLHAAQYTNPGNTPLILNTSFSILKSMGKMELEEMNYFSDQNLEKIYSRDQNTRKDSTFKKLNVVVIIMESFSKEFTASYPAKNSSFTPFLDSLSKYSLVCTHAFANGKKSIDAIPSILAGLPSMMNESYITSSYSGNKISSLANLLHEKGYTSSFFHGGINGTMGFDGFVKMAGFDKYYVKSEYPNPLYYDGDWGIYDEPFFQFFAQELTQKKQPFFSSIFSISSHHPYNVPEKYKNKFLDEALPIYRSIRYADFSLQQFFKTAEKKDWYKNTLFVITADHTSPGEKSFFQNQVGAYAIPLLFYMPGNALAGINNTVTQQIDILPSVLDYLNYDKKYTAFGRSIFSEKKQAFAINYLNGMYQCISGSYALQFDGVKSISVYNYEQDSLLRNNLLAQRIPQKETLQQWCKAFIQTYNHALIQNKLMYH